MKLFLISQEENNDYDTYDCAVVAAENEEIAKEINPSDGLPMVWGKTYSSWCKSADFVSVEYLGEAKDGTEQGVICASFNPG
jgi:hypothetical protein